MGTEHGQDLQSFEEEVEDLDPEFLFGIGQRLEEIILRCSREKNLKPVKNEDNPISDEHLLFMVECITTGADKVPIGKTNRWIGFVQGVMVSKGYTTVFEERRFIWNQKHAQRLSKTRS